MLQSEKQFNSKATRDAFDDIYTNYDLSVNETYLAENGYPYDYPTRWLNDPSMNKRIAIRRLTVTPSSHSFTLYIQAQIDEQIENDQNQPTEAEYYNNVITVDVTHEESLIKVLNHICAQFSYDLIGAKGGLVYEFDPKTNKLEFRFINSKALNCSFALGNTDQNEVDDFLKFLNQPLTAESRGKLTNSNILKSFDEVWDRDRIHFHASFSTSRRKFIGKRGDFYQTLSLLYPAPTNESTFYIRFTTNGIKNILIRHCDFDVQLCFIVNFQKTPIL